MRKNLSLIVLLVIFTMCVGLNEAWAKIKNPSNVIVVAQSDGDFISIQAAIDSINPSSSNPYVIKVMPGTYIENVALKSYVHLQGAGHDVAVIQSPNSSSDVIAMFYVSNVTVSGMTIKGGRHGIVVFASSSIIITDNNIKQNYAYGVEVIHGNTSDNLLKDNIITGNQVGIAIEYLSSPVIRNNYISGNSVYGIYNGSQSATPVNIMENIIINNGSYGINNWAPYSSASVRNNRVTGHTWDIKVDAGTPNVSFNMYDTFYGLGAVGLYNVKSDGTSAPIQ